MCLLKLPVVLIVLSIALSDLKATPIKRQEGIVPVLSRSMFLEPRRAKREHKAGKPKVTRWKSGNATLPRVLNAWQIS
uniref:Uncharacterized protein n=1 Tax=Neovison vison TaxID=452646 RepID=A0A8C7EJX6_NEOVI